eukprot:TRINITY_DN49516_c0_g1_i1.p1 TRINITY_DN49516_c0_g1~~TRINITY_DN49516_c0_g1_i1.p1  ORF type:complete len:271 (-),score=56.54 TRINITY_DN49516_c0_g1_i1:21-833(-)
MVMDKVCTAIAIEELDLGFQPDISCSMLKRYEPCLPATPSALASEHSTVENATCKRRRLNHGAGHGKKGSETLILLDWDDTLLPHTWLQEQSMPVCGPGKPSLAQQAELQKVADSVARTLQQVQALGQTVLITNAEPGWVDLSCNRFLPTVLPLLADMKVISARAAFEHRFPGSPAKWKLMAFEDEVDAFCAEPGQDLRHVISIGDSMHEHTALREATQGKTCFAKSVKFLNRPSLKMLTDQHEALYHCLSDVVSQEDNLDYFMQVDLLD